MKISAIISIAMLFGTLLVLVRDPSMGFFYALAISSNYAFILRLKRINSSFYNISLFFGCFLWSIFLVRPILLIYYPDFYSFIHFNNIVTRDSYIQTFIDIFFFNCSFFIGMVTGGKVMGQFNSIPIKRFRGDTYYLNKNFILFFIFSLISLDYFFLIFFHGGVSGIITKIELIRRVLPFNIILPLTLVFFFQPFSGLSKTNKRILFLIIAIFSILVLLQGSKRAVIQVIFYTLSGYLLLKGNFRLSKKTIALSFILAAFVMISFPMAQAVRITYKPKSDYADTGPAAMVEYALKKSGDDFLLVYLLNKTTARFMGFDGLLTVNVHQNSNIYKSFAPEAIISNALFILIPGFQSGTLTCGKAVSVYYAGIDLEEVHGGAVGCYGALKLIAKGSSIIAYLLCVLFGFFLCATMKCIIALKLPYSLKVIFLLVASYWIVLGISGGNFDRTVGFLIMDTLLVMEFFLFFKLLTCGKSFRLTEESA